MLEKKKSSIKVYKEFPPEGEGVAITDRISVTEAMAHNAALRTS